MALYNRVSLFFINALTLLVPRPLLPPFALFWGGLFFLILPGTRRALRANLRVVTGRDRVDRLVFATFYKFSRNWCDVMLMMRRRGKRLFALIGRQQGHGILDRVLAEGRGAIIISPHLGNWELGGLGLADRGYPVNVMTFREPDERVNALREQVRKERGIGFIYVDRDETSPLAVIEAVNALRRNEVVALLGDRDGSSHTMELDFFGRPAAIPVGAAYLALATGAPVLPVFVPLEQGRYATIMEEPVYFTGNHGQHRQAIRTGMERILRLFEKYIRDYPDQWYNFFAYWNDSTTQKRNNA
ncbi:acyltransferase [Geotalea uraniireducens]|uniref:Acyltransferase n=1 Tax=Geotalea uraniireducens TaxID=351604 RepID=A0ABN6VTB1_9BACT|nr:lysophospholipid acyltransferase family protein [Geotalea uraniireducens]BDV41280.1 acyltransferase [Geotalea uraniireducens]